MRWRPCVSRSGNADIYRSGASGRAQTRMRCLPPHAGRQAPASEAAHLQGRPRASAPARCAGLVSEDMARERQRRAWEAGEHGVLAAELAEEAAQRERIQARRCAVAHPLWLDVCTCPPLRPLLQSLAALTYESAAGEVDRLWCAFPLATKAAAACGYNLYYKEIQSKCTCMKCCCIPVFLTCWL